MIPPGAVLLLEQLSPAVASDVLSRLAPDAMDALLGRSPLTAPFVARVVAHGTHRQLLAIVANSSVGTGIRERFLDQGDPELAAAVYRSHSTTRGLQRRVRTMLPPASLLPGPQERAGWQGGHIEYRLYPLFESDDCGTVVAALTYLAPYTRSPGALAAILRGYQQLLQLSGPDAVRDIAGILTDLRRGPPGENVPLEVRSAFENPTDPGCLARALARLGSTEYLADRLANADLTSVGAHSLLIAPRDDELDWDVLSEELPPLARRNFAFLLAREPGCPPQLLPMDWRDRKLTSGRAEPADPADRAGLDELMRTSSASAPRVLNALRAGRLPTADYLARGAPAAYALATLLTGEPALCAEASAALTEPTARHLGEHTDAWVAAVNMLPDFPGTTHELLETAAAMTAP
ncbi:hypothetical protein [Embleya sp. MST-111070]|uniref:hypothetical protein n=1 Tax=Embleya sp. MST-111070 TaxID=3398231 RepID=UPI003F736ECA